AITVSCEHRNRRVLISFTILAAEIVLKSAIAGAQQTQFVPASDSRVRAQGRWISRCHDRQVDILREVMSNSIPAIEPGGTHRARSGLSLSEHHLIDNERTIR